MQSADCMKWNHF